MNETIDVVREELVDSLSDCKYLLGKHRKALLLQEGKTEIEVPDLTFQLIQEVRDELFQLGQNILERRGRAENQPVIYWKEDGEQQNCNSTTSIAEKSRNSSNYNLRQPQTSLYFPTKRTYKRKRSNEQTHAV